MEVKVMKKIILSNAKFLGLYAVKDGVKMTMHACNCCKSCKAGKC